MSDLEQLARAQSDVNDIQALQKNLPFTRYFRRRLNEIRDQLANDVLHGSFSTEELVLKKREYSLAKMIASLMDDDLASNKSILDGRE